MNSYFVRENFEEAMVSYVVHHGRNIKNVRSDKMRVVDVCKEGWK